MSAETSLSKQQLEELITYTAEKQGLTREELLVMALEELLETTRRKRSLIHHHGVQCPECGKHIVILLGIPEAITVKEFQKRSQEFLKEITKDE